MTWNVTETDLPHGFDDWAETDRQTLLESFHPLHMIPLQYIYCRYADKIPNKFKQFKTESQSFHGPVSVRNFRMKWTRSLR